MATVRYDKKTGRFRVILLPGEVASLEKMAAKVSGGYSLELLLKEAVTKRWAIELILNFAYARSRRRLPNGASLSYGADLALFMRGYTFRWRRFRWERKNTPLFAPPD